MKKNLYNAGEKENLSKLLGVHPETIGKLSQGSIYQLLWIKYFGNVKERSKDNFVSENLFLSTMMNKFLRKGVSQDA